MVILLRSSDRSLPWIDKEGEIIGLFGISRDITERKKAEEALRKSEEEYRSLFVNMFNGYAYQKIVLDEENKPVDYVFLEVNDGLERLTGLRKEDLIGKRITEVIPGRVEAHPELLEIFGRVALTGKGEDFVIEYKPFEKWLHISVYSPRKDYFVSITEDITERKTAEKELRESQAQYLDLYNNAPNVYFSIGLNGRVLRCNKRVSELLGYLPEKLVGRPVMDLYADTPEGKSAAAKVLKRIQAGEIITGHIVSTCESEPLI